MNNEGKKMLILLSGVLGIAIITVLTVLVLQMILQRNVTPSVPPLDKPVVQTPVTVPNAEVISVKPHYITASIPKRECRKVKHIVYLSHESSPTGAGAVIGGLTGGLLGSQVGGGNGKIVTSAAGAAIGALTGNNMQNSMNAPQPHIVYTNVCSTHYVKTTIQKGYEVTYLYNGQQGVVIMNEPLMIGSVLPFPIK